MRNEPVKHAKSPVPPQISPVKRKKSPMLSETLPGHLAMPVNSSIQKEDYKKINRIFQSAIKEGIHESD